MQTTHTARNIGAVTTRSPGFVRWARPDLEARNLSGNFLISRRAAALAMQHGRDLCELLDWFNGEPERVTSGTTVPMGGAFFAYFGHDASLPGADRSFCRIDTKRAVPVDQAFENGSLILAPLAVDMGIEEKFAIEKAVWDRCVAWRHADDPDAMAREREALHHVLHSAVAAVKSASNADLPLIPVQVDPNAGSDDLRAVPPIDLVVHVELGDQAERIYVLAMPAAAPVSCEEADWDVIHTVSRADLIASGDLVQVESRTAAAAGFRHPVAITIGAWNACVEWSKQDSIDQVHQDEQGRLTDVLFMAAMACRRPSTVDEASREFDLMVVPRDGKSVEPVIKTLKIITGPGDRLEQVMTILLPHED